MVANFQNLQWRLPYCGGGHFRGALRACLGGLSNERQNGGYGAGEAALTIEHSPWVFGIRPSLIYHCNCFKCGRNPLSAHHVECGT